MSKLKIYFFFLLSLLLTSCIPTKDLTYFQDKGENKDEKPVEVVNQKPYRLQINDILTINIKAIDPKLVEIFNINTNPNATMVSNEQSYMYGYTVDNHGNIRLPMLGELNVLGFTIEEVRLKIEQLLHEKYFKSEAGVFVIVKLSGFRYTVNGEIASPGTKVLYQEKVNIMEAIANSGDITMTGNRKDVKVIRNFAQGAETFSIDLTDKNAVNSPCFNLQPNDYIYVKPLKQKSWGTGKTGLESLTTLVTILSLATTTFLLLKG